MRILGYIWSLPNTLIGLLLAVAYWPTGFRVVDGCLELRASRAMIGRPAGQTWGCVIWYDKLTWGMESLGRRAIRHHEQVHVRQGMIGGVFFMLAYAAHFLYLWGRHGFGWYSAYRAIYFERVAYDAQWRYIQNELARTDK